MFVHVLNKEGMPLAPCSPAKAKKLLLEGRASKYNANTGQFTIKLYYGSSGYQQGFTVGIDPGETVGIAAVGGKEIVYAKELIQRRDVSKKIKKRTKSRRRRRASLRYRPARFNNRTKTKCARCGKNNVPVKWKKNKYDNITAQINNIRRLESVIERLKELRDLGVFTIAVSTDFLSGFSVANKLKDGDNVHIIEALDFYDNYDNKQKRYKRLLHLLSVLPTLSRLPDARKRYKWIKDGRKALCTQCAGQKGLDMKPDVLAPSIENRADTIVRDIKQLMKSLPIEKIIVETASFDTQKMANPDIQGLEYQQGTLMGYEIVGYLMATQGGKCAYCRGQTHARKMRIDHILPENQGGSEKISNLVMACETCNDSKCGSSLEVWARRLEKEEDSTVKKFRLTAIKYLIKRRDSKKGFKYSAITQSYKRYLLRELSKLAPVEETTGAITAYNRNKLGYEKSHVIDAIVIASQGKPVVLPDKYIVERRLKERKAAKFIDDQNKKKKTDETWQERFQRTGFNNWDKVQAKDKRFGTLIGYVSSIRSTGWCRISDIWGRNMLEKALGKKDPSITYEKLELIRRTVSTCVRENHWLLPKVEEDEECIDHPEPTQLHISFTFSSLSSRIKNVS